MSALLVGISLQINERSRVAGPTREPELLGERKMTRAQQNQKKQLKIVLYISAGFACLMLAVSLALFLGNNEEPVCVDTQNAQTEKVYDLEGTDIDKVEIPVSKIKPLEWPANGYEADKRVLVLGNQIGGDQNAQVPEPGTLALLAIGGLGIMARYRRRRG